MEQFKPILFGQELKVVSDHRKVENSPDEDSIWKGTIIKLLVYIKINVNSALTARKRKCFITCMV